MVSSSAKNDDCEVIREFFRTYDRNAIQAVDAIDFIAGMSIFCHGRKSEKLAFVFDLMITSSRLVIVSFTRV